MFATTVAFVQYWLCTGLHTATLHSYGGVDCMTPKQNMSYMHPSKAANGVPNTHAELAFLLRLADSAVWGCSGCFPGAPHGLWPPAERPSGLL